jgi:hypothetical protein
MQNSFSKSFSVNLVLQWCMAWFCALKNERTRRTTFYYTHTTYFFLLHTIIIIYSKALHKVVLSKIVLSRILVLNQSGYIEYGK